MGLLINCFGVSEGRRRARASPQAGQAPPPGNTLVQAPTTAVPPSSNHVPSSSCSLLLGWSHELMSALCFSVAVLSSDTRQVLYHNCGNEPAAAQLLQAMLSKIKHSQPGNESPSILSLLLGSELQAGAEEALTQERPWRCTICVSLTSQPSMPQASECCNPSKSKPSSASMEGPVQAQARAEALDAGIRGSSASSVWDVTGQDTRQGTAKGGRRTKYTYSIGRMSQDPSIRKGAQNRQVCNTGVHWEVESSMEPLPPSLRDPAEVNYNGILETDECCRTAVLLRELEAGKARSSFGGPTSSGRHGSLQVDTHETHEGLLVSSELVPGEGLLTVQPPTFSTATREVTPLHQATSEMKENIFDICVSRARTNTGSEGSSVVVTIHNSTEHGKTKAALSSLSETQLELLSSMMPLHAIQFLAKESMEAVPANISQLARRHRNATLLFLDIAGFTSYSGDVEPEHVMILLNSLFSVFDSLTDECQVHKLETAGDCYLVCGGVLSTCQSASGFSTLEDEGQDPAEAAKRVMRFAVKAMKAASMVTMPGTQEPVRVRIGIHTGDCVSGLIGAKLPKFSLFGDAMNVASRMESTGKPGHIHVSEATYRLLQHEHCWQPTGGVKVKGKGEMQTYLWVENPCPSQADLSSVRLNKPEARAASAPGKVLRKFSTLLQHVGPNRTASLNLPIMYGPA